MDDLFKRWKEKKDPEALEGLFNKFNSDIEYVKHTFKEADLPDYIIEAEAKKNFVKGLESFDPSKNASLRTHLVNYMKKTNRLVYTYQNVGKIPEERIFKVTRFKNAENNLKNKLGRVPSAQEIADELGWDIKEVSRIRRELRPGTRAEEIAKETYDFVQDSLSDYMYYSLPPNMQTLFEALTGYAGAQKLTPSQIKAKFGWTESEYQRQKRLLLKELEKRGIRELL